MVQIENNNKYNIGDVVWWFDAWNNLQTGKIYGFEEDHAKIRQGRYGGVSTGAPLSGCWPSQKECLEAEAKRAYRQKLEYKDSIKDVKDLVKFLLENDVCSEFRDYDAEAAAKERASEMLGIIVE